MPPSSRRLALAAAAALLCACPPASLSVRLASDDPSFSISEEGQPRPRYHTLDVVLGGDTVWLLRAEPFGDTASSALVRYGQTPAGFVETLPARPLVPGHYRIAVRGPLEGALNFTVGADGGVNETPP